METRSVGDWIQVGANVGILAGLVLVAIQIDQNTRAIAAQMRSAGHDTVLQKEYAILGEDPAAVWAKSIESPNDLSLAEQRIVEAYIWSELERWRFAYDMGQEGFIKEQHWKTLVQRQAFFFFGNSYGRAWWEYARENVPTLPPEMIPLVDQALESEYETSSYFSEIKARIR